MTMPPLKIKICGMTSAADACKAAEFGADALGFNFYPRSARYISPAAAGEIIRQLPDGVLTVGVFVNSTVDEIEAITATCPLDLIQLHGNETPDFVNELRTRTTAGIVKAVAMKSGIDLRELARFDVDEFLLDSDTETFGGSGETFDWKFAANFADLGRPFYLAGGLTPRNVVAAIREVRPCGVDVCSGVESSKGKKDVKKMADFIRKARTAL